MPAFSEKPKKSVTIATRPRQNSSDSSSDGSLTITTPLRSPRTPRFAEATAVNSPIERTMESKSPFVESLTTHYTAQAQPSDVGFGYVNKHESVEMPMTPKNEYPTMPKSPLKSPLKSAMRTPGAPPRDVGRPILTPAFHEEYLEKREKHTEKRQAKDLAIKTKVRVAKILMRGVNFSCSLIVLAMLAATLTVFNASKDLPSRGGFTPWAPGQVIWPQIVVLSIASISLFASVIVMWAYWKGGNKRGRKASTFYTITAVAFFMFSILMWGAGAAILQTSKKSNDGKDMWSWSCKKNTRAQLYNNDVPYALLCRLQNWSLVCIIIEVVIETFTIAVYAVVFYRLFSKRALRKTMAHRDRARGDLYLSQMRAQSAPNTPGFNGPMSARDGGWMPPLEYDSQQPDIDVEEGLTQYVNADQKHIPEPFQLQAPPIRVQGATPKMEQVGFAPIQTSTPAFLPAEEQPLSPFMAEMPQETQQEHFAPAPGEQVYAFVAPPGAYEPLASPGPEEQHFGIAR